MRKPHSNVFAAGALRLHLSLPIQPTRCVFSRPIVCAFKASWWVSSGDTNARQRGHIGHARISEFFEYRFALKAACEIGQPVPNHLERAPKILPGLNQKCWRGAKISGIFRNIFSNSHSL